VSEARETNPYQVGYGKPPKKTQFQKGRSGNPKGRPKGALNISTVLERTLREVVVITENGRRRQVTKMEAAVKQLVNQATSGDLAALRQLMALVASAERLSNDTEAGLPSLKVADQKVMAQILERFEKSTRGDGNASEF
jgi:hypothetical protein